jgi:hypothetical protein
MSDHHITIDESERQAMLLALAYLAVDRPGWDYMLNELAKKLDNVKDGRAQMYDEFRKTREAIKLVDRLKSNQLAPCSDPRVQEMILHAWVGEDELGSGKVGIKAGVVPAGCIPLVACETGKVDQDYIIKQMREQGSDYGKIIRLVRFAYHSVEIELVPPHVN